MEFATTHTTGCRVAFIPAGSANSASQSRKNLRDDFTDFEIVVARQVGIRFDQGMIVICSWHEDGGLEHLDIRTWDKALARETGLWRHIFLFCCMAHGIGVTDLAFANASAHVVGAGIPQS